MFAKELLFHVKLDITLIAVFSADVKMQLTFHSPGGLKLQFCGSLCGSFKPPGE